MVSLIPNPKYPPRDVEGHKPLPMHQGGPSTPILVPRPHHGGLFPVLSAPRTFIPAVWARRFPKKWLVLEGKSTQTARVG